MHFGIDFYIYNLYNIVTIWSEAYYILCLLKKLEARSYELLES